MSNKTESNIYTIIFAVAMVVIVGSLLAYAASSLEPTISENKRLEKQQNILYAMGVNENDESSATFISTDKAPQAFSEFIKKQLVIQDGQVIEDDQAYLIDVKKEKSAAKKEGYSRKLPLFIGEKDGQTYYVAPIYGKGLWDAIWGFISVDENMVVQGVYFDHKAETPGLGANIKMRFFMDDFIGESLMDGNSYAGIEVAKGNNDPLNKDKSDNEVDALAGATITGNGVSAMIKETLKVYKPYLQTIRKK